MNANVPIELNGAILTHAAIETIKSYQENDNSLLDTQLKILADAMSVILTCNNGDASSARIAAELAYLREAIATFAKP